MKEWTNMENKNSNKFTSAFLEQQASLPPEQWDEGFRKLVDKRIKENQENLLEYEKDLENEEPEESKEKESIDERRERFYKDYMKSLDLKKDNLRGRKIVDLGCGDNDFVNYLIENNITTEAVGIDVERDGEEVSNEQRRNVVVGDFLRALPVQGVDYIISEGAVSLYLQEEKDRGNFKKTIIESLKAIKESGEIRIAPIRKPLDESESLGLVESMRRYREVMKEISKEFRVEYELTPTDIKATGKDNDLLMDNVLIIKKKNE